MERSSTRFEIAPDHGVSELERLLEQLGPGQLPADSRCIYDGRNRLHRLAHGGVDLVIKHFRLRSGLKRWSYRFRSFKAERAFRNALRLGELGINTPQPVAFVNRVAGGSIVEAWFICHFEDAELNLRDVLNHRVPEGELDHLIDATARFVATLHERGIIHWDLTPGNILISRDDSAPDDWRFSLIDCNRMGFCRPNIRQRCFNLAQCAFHTAGLERFLAAYIDASGISPWWLRLNYRLVSLRYNGLRVLKNKTRRLRRGLQGRTD